MARPIRPSTCHLYVVERYLPGLTLERLMEDELAGGGGSPVRHLESTWIPGDETVLSTYVAASAEVVAATLRERGMPADRIVNGVRFVPPRHPTPQRKEHYW